ncbi:MAG: hypothetical protein ACI959_001909 [Limisphaerales bacterium]|jgi:hypothetical protein
MHLLPNAQLSFHHNGVIVNKKWNINFWISAGIKLAFFALELEYRFIDVNDYLCFRKKIQPK